MTARRRRRVLPLRLEPLGRGMLECSVCNRLIEGRFTVFVPPHAEPFDRIECARRASAAWGAEERLAPIMLPTIEMFRPRSEPLPALVGPRLTLAALAVFALVPGEAALAGGAALLAGGTAASVYLAAKPSPGVLAPTPSTRVQSLSAWRATSPQVPTTSVVTGPPGLRVGERPVGPERTLTSRHASRGPVARHASIAVARDEAVAELRPHTVRDEGAAPQRPAQSSTEPQATPTAEPKPQAATPAPKPTATLKPKPTATLKPKPTGTPKPKPTQTPTPKPPAEPKPKPTGTPKPKPTDTPKPHPVEPQPTPASPPEAHPPTPPAASGPPTEAPPNEPSGPPDPNGSHGGGNGTPDGSHGGGNGTPDGSHGRGNGTGNNGGRGGR